MAAAGPLGLAEGTSLTLKESCVLDTATKWVSELLKEARLAGFPGCPFPTWDRSAQSQHLFPLRKAGEKTRLTLTQIPHRAHGVSQGYLSWKFSPQSTFSVGKSLQIFLLIKSVKGRVFGISLSKEEVISHPLHISDMKVDLAGQKSVIWDILACPHVWRGLSLPPAIPTAPGNGTKHSAA